jgi:hypothetical protein
MIEVGAIWLGSRASATLAREVKGNEFDNSTRFSTRTGCSRKLSHLTHDNTTIAILFAYNCLTRANFDLRKPLYEDTDKTLRRDGYVVVLLRYAQELELCANMKTMMIRLAIQTARGHKTSS